MLPPAFVGSPKFVTFDFKTKTVSDQKSIYIDKTLKLKIDFFSSVLGATQYVAVENTEYIFYSIIFFSKRSGLEVRKCKLSIKPYF